MSLDYTELSQDLGKLIKHYDLFRASAAALDTSAQEILDEFTADNLDLVIEGLAGDFEGWKGDYQQRMATLAQFAVKRLQDQTTVLDQIAASSSDMSEVIPKLIRQMISDSQTINASSIAIGTVTADGTNVGNGTVLVTTTLDGFNSPGSVSGVSFSASQKYKGLASELAVPSETQFVDCIADSYQDFLTEGSESFQWMGKQSLSQHQPGSEGSGYIGNLTGVHGAGLLSNLDFESFSSNAPSSWTIDAGAAGTEIFSDTGSNAYHGTTGLKLLATGGAAITLSQAVSTGVITANRRYLVTARIKASAAVAAGTLTIKFVGTGYSEGATEKISIAFGSLPTSWTLYSFFVNIPATIPSDFKLQISWSGTPTPTKAVWIDDLSFSPVVYGAGIAACVVRGSTPFVRGDRFRFTVANTEGVIQRFFRRVFGYQLPSNTAGGETIADGVAS